MSFDAPWKQQDRADPQLHVPSQGIRCEFGSHVICLGDYGNPLTSVILISKVNWRKNVHWIVPFFAALAKCPDKKSVRGLSAPATEEEIKAGAPWKSGLDYVKMIGM